ncbi:unnamed protein product [Kuraishia capsulata CBS 1993]|uniref:Glucose starvation modulator protein 1 n=1 Tax=Kuraishia capsulata CBS 1993 TaxID=1382522 RepID=W6MWL2_9ASCO|nr:uncharacterized protein KUCA_T00003584001 [Kuraishia capsulata CBS 1993]CDK27605.1 unnamed protein product [Kuraishia capsulata CBS 1993]
MTKRLAPEIKQARRPIQRACTFCHSKHLQCDSTRPCKNCVKRGVEEPCQDVERRGSRYMSTGSGGEGRVSKPSGNRHSRSRSIGSSAGDASMEDDFARSSDASVPPRHGDHITGYVQPTGQHLFYLGSKVPINAKEDSTSVSGDIINTAVQRLSLKNEGDGLDSSVSPHQPQAFQSHLANDEYVKLTDLLTTNPPSPSEYFEADLSLRPFIQLGEDGSMISSYPDNATPNSYQYNPKHSQMPNTASKVPNEIQEEEGYTSPLILRHIIRVPDDIYLTNVVKSYQYPNAYHSLIKYLKERFNREQLIEIAKCMAKYRPSFISATKSLYENDLIFTERSFQRSLLEYENLISVSPSPTIIWRRTGEIVALTSEFATLTGYSKMSLLSKRTFIVELMDDESTIKYFKSFSNMAFGDLNATHLTDCVLRKAVENDYLRCACVWTIKRDVFDIPMLIVGQFLPVLD